MPGWLQDPPADAGSYSFSAPLLKEREYRLDGLFSPPLQRDGLPAVVLEDIGRSNVSLAAVCRVQPVSPAGELAAGLAGAGDLSHRHLDFGTLMPVREFIEHRITWIELQPRVCDPPHEPLTQALSLLLEPENQLRCLSNVSRQQDS